MKSDSRVFAERKAPFEDLMRERIRMTIETIDDEKLIPAP